MDEQRKPGGWAAVRRVLAVIGKTLGTLLLVGFLSALVFFIIFAVYVKNDLMKQAEFSIDNFSLDETSTIYYQDPDTKQYVELQQLYGKENRVWASYDSIPKDLIYACVAIEDRRFFEHQGVDWKRTIGAGIYMFLGSDSYGGSTITQQLIKNLTDEDEVTVRRKLVEIVRALDFAKKHSREEILEWYLNTIYLGEGCYGVQSASRVYFGKDVKDLTLAECACLIGITNNPSIYDPYINPEKNRERQETILREMRDQGYILTDEEYQAALDQKIVLKNTSGAGQEDDDSGYFSYFVDQVIRDVVRDLVEQTGFSETIVNQMVRSGGYSIYCTLDPEVQKAVDAVYEDLDNIPKTASSQQLQSAIAVIDNETGDIVAMAGGVGKKEGSLTLNRATQSYLSPGSTIKPLSVYAPALEAGLVTPASVYDDTPYSFSGGKSWPKNQNGSYRGLTSVNYAVGQSLNTVAVKIVAELTPEVCFRFAKEKLGLTGLVEQTTIAGSQYSDIDYSPMALGSLTRGVTVRQMAAAYAAFPNEGLYRQPRTYTKVVDKDDRVILDNTQSSHQAMDKTAAWYMTYMLQNAVTGGTGSPAKIPNMTVAGKTGTTTSDNDRWFAGFTPYYTGVVWCGYDEPEEVVLTESATNPAAFLWQKVMELAHQGLEDRSFSQPESVISCRYCQDSGLLATEACRKDVRGSREVTGLLALEDAPTGYCNVHQLVSVCDGSGMVANEYCEQVEDNTVHDVGMLNIVRAFPWSGIYVGDQQYVVSEQQIPAGYHPAVSTVADPANQVCYEHTEESLPPEEDPDDPDGSMDPDRLQPPDGEPGTDPEVPPEEDPDGQPADPPDDPDQDDTPDDPDSEQTGGQQPDGEDSGG